MPYYTTPAFPDSQRRFLSLECTRHKQILVQQTVILSDSLPRALAQSNPLRRGFSLTDCASYPPAGYGLPDRSGCRDAVAKAASMDLCYNRQVWCL